MDCALCGVEPAVSGLGWRRKLDDSAVPPAIREHIAEALRNSGIPVGARCMPLAKAADQRALRSGVWAQHQAKLSARSPGIRTDVAVYAAAMFWQNFLWTASRTDSGDVIDLYRDAPPAFRAWYDAIAAGHRCYFNDLRIAFPEGNVYLWSDGDVLLVEGLEVRSRGVGHGTRLLDLVCRVADEQGVAIVGKAEPYYAFGQAPSLDALALMRYYARFGFVGGCIPNEPHGVWRDPRSASTTSDGNSP